MSQNQPQPYLSLDPVGVEDSSLSTLSIFYFILAGLQGLIACVFLIYIGLGVIIALIGASSNQQGDAAAGVGMGGLFACFGLFFMALIGTFAFLNFLAGKSLRQRKRLTLCYVMAVIACLNFPLGTILGIFTFVVLSKPGVKASFQ